MQLGELFFALTFKGKGGDELTKMNDSMSSGSALAEAMESSMDRLIEVVEAMAVKMGAVTYQSVEDYKNKKKNIETTKQSTEAETKNNQKLKDKATLLGFVNTKMKSYFGAMNAARIQTIAATGAFTYFMKKMSDVAVHLDKINSLTGISTNSLQKIGDMAAQSGSSIDDVAGAISRFQQESVNIQLGRGGNIGVWQYLGISPHQDPLKILDQLAVKLKTLPTALGTTMARDLGLSDDLIYFLKNKQNLKSAPEETFLTEKELNRLRQFNIYFNQVFEQGKRTLQKFAAFITPIANGVVYALDRISSMFSGIMQKLEPFSDTIQRFMPVLATMAGVLFAALFPVTAAIIALGIAFEDIWSYFKGDDSLFGRMVNYFKDMNTVVKDTITLIGFLADLITGGTMTDDIIGKVNKYKDSFSGMMDMFSSSPKVEGSDADYNAGKGVLAGPKNTTNNTNFYISGSQDPKVIANEVNAKLNQQIGNSYFQQPLLGY